jgi:hypothetical protein
MDSRDSASGRFIARSEAAESRAHVEAATLMAQFGGKPALEAMYDRLLLVISHRPGAQVIQSRDGEAEAAYAELRRRLDA